MDSNNLLLLLLGVISVVLSRKYMNKIAVILMTVTFLVGCSITKRLVDSLSISLILGSFYTMFFLKHIETYEEFKKSKEN